MIDVIATRTIPADPQAIWPLLDEPGRLGEWFAFADGGEVLEGAGVGRRQRMHGHWGAQALGDRPGRRRARAAAAAGLAP